MIATKMKGFVNNNSAIRAMFEEGNRLAVIHGRENVFDFSLGNPNVPAPKALNDAIKSVIDEESSTFVHGYMSNAGYEDVRDTIAESINKRFDTSFTKDNLIMTVGAAGGLNIILKALINPNDEVIVFAPYFLEYRAYISNYDAKIVEISPNTVDFMPNLDEFKEKISENTKAVIINNPNNPTGVVYSEEIIKNIAGILEEKQKEYGSEIYLISDEPYRELAYDGVVVPYLTKYYANTIVGYSYSKSLSLPGERIGYIVVPSEMPDYSNVYAAASIANRILGFVNAPSLMQRAVAKVVDEKTDIAYYDRNRVTLYEGLTKLGFTCVKPEGAFYLFMKTPMENEKEFCDLAAKHLCLVVPGTSFACPGYVRIAYCVSYETIVNSLPAFEKIANEIKAAGKMV